MKKEFNHFGGASSSRNKGRNDEYAEDQDRHRSPRGKKDEHRHARTLAKRALRREMKGM